MRTVLATLLLATVATTARAELRPEEVAILAMDASLESRRLAEYYAEARGVPKSHIHRLLGKPDRVLPRATWDDQMRDDIRKWLAETDPDGKIRCLVTCWDVPLMIGRRGVDAPEVIARGDFLTKARGNLVKNCAELVKLLDAVATEEKPTAREPLAADAAIADLGARLDGALKEAQKRLQELDAEEKKKQEGAKFERLFVAGGGVAAWVRMLEAQRDNPKLPPQMIQRLDQVKKQIVPALRQLQALSAQRDSETRDAQLLGLLVKTGGLVGAIRWIDAEQKLLATNETYSSFDSELSLVLWPDYPLFRWVPNLLHYQFDKLPAQPNRRTLMVSRLAAPTWDQAANLIDMAKAAETKGLEGKVYLDARGIKYDPQKHGRGSYAIYDQSVRDLAERLKKHTDLEVVLDDNDKLFQPGDCPDAALYCGWYRLGNYLDAFDWRPGAVGYHMASSEATRLRVHGGKVWCNAALEDGITATLGPAHEPYLAAFPPPDDFFPLLLTGKYTLVETFYRTKAFNSWAMVLVGDPLYNPYKNAPKLSEEDLPDRMKPKEPVAEEDVL
ncbi:MAG: TIGR03790 family protein [Planctomycetes bacterium]|nr:TIGR03790 family protein [Planctomycetota bacterium]